jgi:hypothetical protein
LWGAFSTTINRARRKRIVIGETGWPSSGSPFQNSSKSLPSVPNAQYFLNSFICEAKRKNIEYYYHEAFDADWKRSDVNATDQEFHWGIFNSNRTIKYYVERALDCENLLDVPAIPIEVLTETRIDYSVHDIVVNTVTRTDKLLSIALSSVTSQEKSVATIIT